LNYLLIFIFQAIFNVAKVYEIKYAYENQLKGILISSTVLSLLTIMSTYLSIELLLAGDLKVILVYVTGSLTGKYIAYLSEKNNYRAKLYKLLNNGRE
jgi:hypothetical protein